MLIEYNYSPRDLRKRCYNCKWLESDNNISGVCKCPDNHIKDRDRDVFSRACTYKTYPIEPIKQSDE